MNRFRQVDCSVERRIGLAKTVDDFDFVAGEQATLLKRLETGGGFGAVTQFHFDSLLCGFQENQFTSQKIRKRRGRDGSSKRRPKRGWFAALLQDKARYSVRIYAVQCIGFYSSGV